MKNPYKNLNIRTNYYPFGMQIPARSYSSESYRYGFNGKEKIDEISGNGNSYDLGARIYNPLLGKMFSPDPREKEYPWQSTYAYYANSPIWQTDYKGEGGDSNGTPAKEPTYNPQTKKFEGQTTTAQDNTYNPQSTVDKDLKIPYTAPPISPPPVGEIKDADKAFAQKRHNEIMNSDPVTKACYTDPTLKAVATSGLVVATPVVVSSLVPATATTVTTVKTAVDVTLDAAAKVYFTNPQAVELVGGVGFGFIMSILTPTIPDMPQLSITPMFDYGNAAGTTTGTIINLFKENQQTNVPLEQTQPKQP